MINNTAATADGMERETFTSQMFFSVLSTSLLGGREISSIIFFILMQYVLPALVVQESYKHEDISSPKGML
jgi:hypothetical protein